MSATMYAIVQTGGKQYRVQPGDVIKVEKLPNDLGAEFDFTEIVALGGESFESGMPHVPGAKVTAVVTKQTKSRKVIIFKKKRRQGYRRLKTHRQPYTEIFIKAISFNGKVQETPLKARVIDVPKERAERNEAKRSSKRESVEA